LLLAGLGLYGVTAYAVTRRRVEIAIRTALGAAPANILRMVLARISLLLGVGLCLGSLLGMWASKFVATLLFGVTPHDPETLVGSAALFTLVAFVAGGVPACRASPIDRAMMLQKS
jgi:putative ABC transport system permease protein